jgi:hypothetical protein
LHCAFIQFSRKLIRTLPSSLQQELIRPGVIRAFGRFAEFKVSSFEFKVFSGQPFSRPAFDAIEVNQQQPRKVVAADPARKFLRNAGWKMLLQRGEEWER